VLFRSWAEHPLVRCWSCPRTAGDGRRHGSMKATVIHNRMAGAARRKREDFAQAVDVLHRAGWDLDLRVTTHAGHAVEIARQAVSDGVEVVVAAGGDGTVNEVIQALAYTD